MSDYGKPVAYINLIEDKIFNEFEQLLKITLDEKSLETNSSLLNDLIFDTFGITCDKINKGNINFNNTQKKCICNSSTFNSEMVKPETYESIELPIVSHEEWNELSEKTKKKYIWLKIQEVFDIKT